jgi:hypothetical protein
MRRPTDTGRGPRHTAGSPLARVTVANQRPLSLTVRRCVAKSTCTRPNRLLCPRRSTPSASTPPSSPPRPAPSSSPAPWAVPDDAPHRSRRPRLAHSGHQQTALIWDLRTFPAYSLYFHSGGSRGFTSFTSFAGFSPETGTALAAFANTSTSTLRAPFIQTAYGLLRSLQAAQAQTPEPASPQVCV